jgi:tRNA (guanine26-N2/guanine27-N2)-dimethyltransferase
MKLVLAKEGDTSFFIPVQDESDPFPPGTADVFFNPRMALSRDATVLLCAVLRPRLYLDVMGATGARGLRVAHESGVPVVINDRSPVASELIRKNLSFSGLSAEACREDTNVLLSSRVFDAVDLDPFGSPASFIDSAIRGAGRYLMVTATDTAPLCGAHLRAGRRRYFSEPANTEYHAEVGLRTLLAFVVRETVKYDRGIEPVFCFSHTHYHRLHLRLIRGASAADRSMGRIGFVIQCRECPWRTEVSGLHPPGLRCGHCGAETFPIGPLWTGHIQDHAILAGMEDLIPRMTLSLPGALSGLLQICREEIPTASHYQYHLLAHRLRCSPPKIGVLLDRLAGMGYPATRTHFAGEGFKTGAPLEEIYRAVSGTPGEMGRD